MNNIEPYEKRPVEFLKQVSSGGWRIKVYGISAKSEPLSKELVSEGIKAVLSHLPQPASRTALWRWIFNHSSGNNA